MAQTSTANLTFTLGSVSITSIETRTGAEVASFNITLPIGIAGLMNGTTSIDALDSSHGFSVADLVDIHWTDPTDASHKCRRGIRVDTSNTNDIIFDEAPAGEGDALPADGTVVIVGLQITVTAISIVGADIVMAASGCDQQSNLDFRTGAASIQSTKHALGSSWGWIKNWGDVNPFVSDTILNLVASNGSTTIATMTVAVMYDIP